MSDSEIDFVVHVGNPGGRTGLVVLLGRTSFICLSPNDLRIGFKLVYIEIYIYIYI